MTTVIPTTAGAAAGTWVSGVLYDWSGGYVAGFAFSVVSVLLALGAFWMVPTRSAKG